MNKFTRISLKVVAWIIGIIIGLLLLVFILIRIPAVQNFAVQKVVNFLETKIGTPVEIGRVSLNLPKLLVLEGVYFEDQQQDTLLAGERLLVDISLLKLLDNKVEINELNFQGITANINRKLPDSAFNFDYIIRAFTTEEVEETSKDTASAMAFSIDKINLDRIQIRYDDEIIGTNADVYLGHLDTRIKTFDLENMRFEIPKLTVNGLKTTLLQSKVATAEHIPSTDDLGVERAVGAEAPMPDLKLGEVDFRNIQVVYADEASAMDARVSFNRLAVTFKDLDLNKENIQIDRVLLEDTDAAIVFGPGSGTSAADESASDTAASAMNWIVGASDIDIKNTNISFDDNSAPRLRKGMDYAHMGIKDLQVALNGLYFSTDSISGEIDEFSFKERSGLEIQKLETQFAYTNTGILLEDLLLQTPNTRISDYVSVKYPSLEALSENPELIELNINWEKGRLGMKDVALLVPTLDTMQVMKPLLNKTLEVDAALQGTLANLNISRFVVSTLDDTYLNIKGSVRNAMDPARLFADLDISTFRTSRRDINRLVAASMIPEGVEIPRSVNLRGRFKGGMNNFNTNMRLNSSVGNASVLAQYNAGRDTSYRANMVVESLDVGSFLSDTTLGKVSFSAKVDGVSLDPRTMVATGEATLISAEAMGYRYHDIKLDFKANAGDLQANLLSSDPNLALAMTAAGQWKEQYPSVTMNLVVDSLNMRNLNLTTDDIRYRGRLEADLPTADPDFLNGTVAIVKSDLIYKGEQFLLDSILLEATAADSLQTINLYSEFLTASVFGNYQLSQIGMAMQDVIATYYNPSNIQDTSSYRPQTFDFNAEFVRSPFIRRMVPGLTEMDPVTLFGNFDSQQRSLNARLGASHVLYDGTVIDDVSLDVNTADSTLFYAANLGLVNLSNIEVLNTLISGNVRNSIVDAGLWVRDSIDREQYHIGVNLAAQSDNFVFNMKPDGLILNYDQWAIDPSNRILFGSGGILAQNFVLSNEDQQLRIESRDSSLNAPIELLFSNFRIETFTRIIESSTLTLGGGINGNATVDRLEGSPTFVSDLTVNNFYFGNDTVGDIGIQVDNLKENTFAANVTITGNGNDVNLTGDFISPPDQPSTMDFVLNMNRLNMSTLEAFSFGSLRRTQGYLDGKLDITGSPSAPRVNGALLFNDARLNVSMLNADFSLTDDRIEFNDEGISFPNLSITDSVGNEAVIDGMIRTKTYTDFAFDLGLRADDFQVLNSTAIDNEMFYGLLFLDTDLKIGGTMTSPEVSGSLNVNENTRFTFVVPDDNPGTTEREGVVEFVDKSDSTAMLARLDTLRAEAPSGMDISLNIGIDPDAEFNVVIDPGTGDALFIKGTAQLNADIDQGGNITLAGTYEVEEGSYELSFNMLRRRFLFKKGSTIVWNGDVMSADLNITAAYDIDAAPIDLLENQLGGRNSNYYKQKIPFEVNLILGGEMLKPNISFDITLDEENAGVSQDVTSLVNTRLSQIRENETEINKQVFALIILGRFVAENPFSSAAGGGGVESMARNSVSDLLSAQLNNLAGDLIAGVELNFDLQSTEDYSTGAMENRTDLNVGVSKRLLNDRLKVSVGSNFEVEGGGQPGRSASNIAGDIEIEYQLSKDGRYFLRAFRKNEYEVTLQGQVIETGLGFNINMDYNRFKELFMRAERLQRYQKEVEEEKRKELMEYAPASEATEPKNPSQAVEFRDKDDANDK